MHCESGCSDLSPLPPVSSGCASATNPQAQGTCHNCTCPQEWAWFWPMYHWRIRKSSPAATVRFMPLSSNPNVPICGASLSASADCGVGIICSLDCPAHAARMEVDRISVIIFVTAGLDIKNIVLKRSEEHTPELQSLMRISYAVFCLKKKKH